MPRSDLGTKRPPGRDIVRDEIDLSKQMQTRGQSRRHANWPAHHQPWDGSSTPGRSTLSRPDFAKCLLQVIVRFGQISDLITEKEMRSIALGHLQEVQESRVLAMFLFGLLSDQDEVVLKVSTHRLCFLLFQVASYMGNLVKTLIERTHHGKELLGSRQPLFQEPLQAVKFDGKPLFSATRSIESLIWESRSCKRNPEAHSGGRPSSVKLALTARQ